MANGFGVAISISRIQIQMSGVSCARGLKGMTRPFYSSPAFARQLPVPQYLFYPCIDPLSEKNKELDERYVQKVCDDFGLDRSRPIVTQVSRFDRLKDPVGVVQAYKLARKSVDCQLVLAGGGGQR